MYVSYEGRIAFLVVSLPTIDKETKEYMFERVALADDLFLDYKKLDNGKIMISRVCYISSI